MAWSDAARKAAAMARRLKARNFSVTKKLALKERRNVEKGRIVRTPYQFEGKTYYHEGREHGNAMVRTPKARMGRLVARANSYYGDSRRQGAAVKKLSSAGLHPKTGKYVGKRKASRVARRLGDMANE